MTTKLSALLATRFNRQTLAGIIISVRIVKGISIVIIIVRTNIIITVRLQLVSHIVRSSFWYQYMLPFPLTFFKHAGTSLHP